MNRQALARRIHDTSRLTGSFTLRSGQVSDTYFDKYQFEASPTLLRDICIATLPLLPDGTRVLAGLEMGGIPIATVLSQLTGLPAAFVRKAPKTYGTCRYAEGAALAGRQVTLIEDVVSSGGAIVEAAQRLRSDGVPVDRVVCVIDRRSSDADALAAEGLELTALFTMAELEAAAEAGP